MKGDNLHILESVYNYYVRFGNKGFYVTPWFSIDYVVLEGGDVVMGGKKYEFQSIVSFPTFHLGYAF
ncbi:MAG: hypothetical protein AB8G05_11530 [Oligoflexales bacterium]